MICTAPSWQLPFDVVLAQTSAKDLTITAVAFFKEGGVQMFRSTVCPCFKEVLSRPSDRQCWRSSCISRCPCSASMFHYSDPEAHTCTHICMHTDTRTHTHTYTRTHTHTHTHMRYTHKHAHRHTHTRCTYACTQTHAHT